MNVQDGLSKLISKVWVDYCAELKKEPLSIVNFCIVNDINQEYRKIRPDHAEKYPEQREIVLEYANGLFNLCVAQKEVKEMKQTINILKELSE